MAELNASVHSEIKNICRNADKLADKGYIQDALTEYWKAYDMVPEPKADWEAALWILVAIGDTNFLKNDFHAAIENLSSAMHFPEAIGNAFIHLRLGQCFFETGDLDKAADELTRAYAIEGEDIFRGENHKYFNFLKTKITIEKKKPWWRFGKG